MTYWTPVAPPTPIDLTTSEVPERRLQSIQPELRNDGTEVILPLVWNEYSRSDLASLFEIAQSSSRHGDTATAEQDFRRAMEGYSRLFGISHEETCKVYYAAASFYASQDRMMEADKILQDLTQALVKRWGPRHDHTQAHVDRVVELLNNWQRHVDALAFLERAEDLEESVTDIQHTRGQITDPQAKGELVISGRPLPGLNPNRIDAALTMIKDADPRSIDHGISIAKKYVVEGNSCVEPLLLAMADQCEYGGYEKRDLAVRRLRVWTNLLKLWHKTNTVREHSAQFRDAERAFVNTVTAYNWSRHEARSLDILEESIQLAASCLRSGHLEIAATIFRRTTEKAEELYGFDENTIWGIISVGQMYQRYSTWENARPWFEQALAAALSELRDEDGVIQSLEKALESGRFSYSRDELSVSRVVFGQSGVVIRPRRLLLE